jgi:hypothetical protein
MNFATYDILSKALPGAVVYLVLLLVGVISKPTDVGDVLTLVVVYLLGYFVDALASLTEPLLFRLMKGSPSERILADDYTGKIFIAQRTALLAYLREQFPQLEPSSRELFALISSVAQTKANQRLIEFQGAYVFARNILTALFIAEGLVCVFPQRWYYPLLIIGLMLLCYNRAKQRGYYWAREAINVYIDCRAIGTPSVIMPAPVISEPK